MGGCTVMKLKANHSVCYWNDRNLVNTIKTWYKNALRS